MRFTYRIVSPFFVAGVDFRDGRAVHAAAIVRYMMGWTPLKVARYCGKRGWEWEMLPHYSRR